MGAFIYLVWSLSVDR